MMLESVDRSYSAWGFEQERLVSLVTNRLDGKKGDRGHGSRTSVEVRERDCQQLKRKATKSSEGETE